MCVLEKCVFVFKRVDIGCFCYISGRLDLWTNRERVEKQRSVAHYKCMTGAPLNQFGSYLSFQTLALCTKHIYGRKSADRIKPHFDVIFFCIFERLFLATYRFAMPKIATFSENIWAPHMPCCISHKIMLYKRLIWSKQRHEDHVALIYFQKRLQVLA